MGNLKKLIQNIKKAERELLKLPKLVIEDDKDGIVKQIRAQLMDGETGQGLQLAPNYLNDPYFKTQDQAKAYVAWKSKITPSTNRRPETPNLYINGKFHKSLTLQVGQKQTKTVSTWSTGQNKIMPKYGIKAFAPNETYMDVLRGDVKRKALDILKTKI